MTELMTFIFDIARIYLIPGVMVLGAITALFSSILCLHFNYHYYLIHGKILWDMASDNPDEVKEVIKLNGLKWGVGVGDAMLAPCLFITIGLITSIMWPVSLILLSLLILLHVQKFLFRGRHRKIMFERKLKGLHRD